MGIVLNHPAMIRNDPQASSYTRSCYASGRNRADYDLNCWNNPDMHRWKQHYMTYNPAGRISFMQGYEDRIYEALHEGDGVA